MRKLMFKSCLFAGAAMIAGSPALAQTSQTQEEEIVVTAQNRVENVQDVPIAIQVVSGDTLEKAGISDFSGIQQVAPAVQIVQDTNLTRVTVRGVGTNDNAETQDTSIAVNIDGEYINRPTVLNAGLFDLARVEVLRGPQGTLYGRNATGGAINFITRKPGRDLGFNLTASYGNFDHVLVQGGIDLPFGEIGGIRVAGTYSKRDGYFSHPNLTISTGDDYTRGGRISLALRPTDALTIDAAVEHVASDRLMAAQAYANFNSGPGFNAAYAPGATCNQNGFVRVGADTRLVVCIPQNTNALAAVDRGNYLAPARSPSVQEQRTTAVRGRVSYDFGGATLTYTGGYRTTDESFDAALAPAYTFKNFANDVDTQSHELRINGGKAGGIQWQAGAFHFKEELDIERGLFNGPPYLPAFLLGANGGYINYFDRQVSSASWAVFAQTDIPITETLTAVVGARYTWDDRSAVFNVYGSGIGNAASPLNNTGPVRITAAPLSVQRPSASAEKFTWLAGLNYQPDADTLVYAKVSTGFKAGGFDSVGSYAPESNTAYEAGIKRSFGGGGANFVNVSGFYYDYKDLQASVLLDNSIGGQVFNAGKARIWGIELDASFKVLENGRFTASVNYLDSKYQDFLASYAVFCASSTLPSGCVTGLGDIDSNATAAPIVQPNLAGNRPPQSPSWVIAAGYEHRFDLGGSGSITPSVFSRYKSSYFVDIFNYNDSRQKAFFQTDASIEWRSADDKFGVQAFVRNLEDNQPLTYAGFTAAGNDDIYVWQFGTPRTYGVRLSLDF
ncbi:MAG: TonB-dependent receptor [Sphingomonas sp.]